jgi:hypothetical protein
MLNFFCRLLGRSESGKPASGNNSALRALIETHRFFDRPYYLANYREDIPHGTDPLAYYLTTGQHLGHKPNPGFDPLLYLLRRPEAREAGPVLHYLQSLSRGEAPPADLTTVSLFPEVRPPKVMLNVSSQPEELKRRDLEESLEQSHAFGQKQVLRFSVDGKDYRLVAPSAADFFNRLRDDKPFALSRLPHGFWDCLHQLRTARGQVAEVAARLAPQIQFSHDEIDRLAQRACDAVMPEMAVYQENFLHELLSGIARDETGPEHLRSVSFKWQPTVADRVFGRTDSIGELELQQLREFAAHFKPETPLMEAMIWKRWVYSGDIMRLPTEARERPVVLVGANRMQALGNRLRLPLFSHLEIPLSSYHLRYEIFDRCKAAVREAQTLADWHGTKSPLIMFQGGSFAYWLIARLHKWDPSVFYIDFGQALHVWFLDNGELWAPWLACHPRLVMENCKLDDFYRDLGIQLAPPFGLPPSAPPSGD